MLHIVILVAWYIRTFATHINNVLLDTTAAVQQQYHCCETL